MFFLIAEEITKIVAFLILDEEWPKKNLIRLFFNLSTFLLRDLSLPCTSKPSPIIIRANPLIPIPPIPTKCIISDFAKFIFIIYIRLFI